jgi:L-amino acid N-acyltransferase YncA
MSPLIRPCQIDDLDRIQAIYAHHVLTGTGTFELDPPSRAEIETRWRAVVSAGWPWLVAEADGAVLGYAYAGPFRARAAYAHTVEDSIYLDLRAQGRGLGKALLFALMAAAREAGAREMLAVIGDSQNRASINLHKACGFRSVGAFERVGFKFDRWLDIVLMQSSLRPEDTN